MSDYVAFATYEPITGFQGFPMELLQGEVWEGNFNGSGERIGSVGTESTPGQKPLVGPGTSYQVGLTRAQLVKWYWRAKAWSFTLNIGTLSASAPFASQSMSSLADLEITASDEEQSFLTRERELCFIQPQATGLSQDTQVDGDFFETDENIATSAEVFADIYAEIFFQGPVIQVGDLFYPPFNINVQMRAAATETRVSPASSPGEYSEVSELKTGIYQDSSLVFPSIVDAITQTGNISVTMDGIEFTVPYVQSTGQSSLFSDGPGNTSASLAIPEITGVISEYWPYAAPPTVLYPHPGYNVGDPHPNAGQPIWDSETGEKLLDPVTGFPPA